MKKKNRLTKQFVAQKRKPGLYSDGCNLYLQITPAGVKSWLFRFMIDGKARGMGLGPVHTYTLDEARKSAIDAKKLLDQGIDPIEHRKQMMTETFLKQMEKKRNEELWKARYFRKSEAIKKRIGRELISDQYLKQRLLRKSVVPRDIPKELLDVFRLKVMIEREIERKKK